MSDHKDYDRRFNTSIRCNDPSKQRLLEALQDYAHFIRKFDANWYLSLKKEADEDVAFDTELEVWKAMEVYDVRLTCRLFGIKGNDVTALFKATQMSPRAWALQKHFDLKNPRLGIWTVTRCPTLLALEREGAGRERRVCQNMETQLIKVRATTINPNIKVTPLKLPPRRSKHEIHCQWEFRLTTASTENCRIVLADTGDSLEDAADFREL